MALTQPFLSPIPSVRPNQTTRIIDVNVLGGDTVTRIYWQLEDINGNVIADGSQAISNDIETDDIRTFRVTTSGYTFVANTKYAFRVHTQHSSFPIGTPTENSIWSEAELFDCYVAPTISFYEGEYISQSPISNNYIFTSQPAKVGVVFSKNDNDSPAVLASATIQLYNSDGDLVFSGDAYQEYPIEIEGFAENVTYRLYAVGKTTDGTTMHAQATGLTYVATPATGDLTIEAENVCSEGYIDLTCKVANITGTPNLEVQRQELGDTKWITLCTVPYDDIVYNTFNIFDRLAGSNRIYLYRLVLVAPDGTRTVGDPTEVLSKFTNTYICDGETSFKLTNEWTESESKRVYKSGLYEPYGSKYPVVVNNAVLGYDAGTTSAMVLSANTEQDKHIDRYGEVKLAKQFADFLTNRKPKVLKDFNGNLRIITIQSNISRNYVKELGNGICSTSFSWVEISDFSQSNIDKIGLLNIVKMRIPTATIELRVDAGIEMTNTATTAYIGSIYRIEFTAPFPIAGEAYVQTPVDIYPVELVTITDGTTYYITGNLRVNGDITYIITAPSNS